MNHQIIMWLLGIITTVALSLAAYSLRSVTLLSESNVLIQYQLQQLQTDRDIDIEQNRRLADLRSTDRKFWKLHQWARTELNQDNAKAGEPLASWPNIEAEN